MLIQEKYSGFVPLNYDHRVVTSFAGSLGLEEETVEYYKNGVLLTTITKLFDSDDNVYEIQNDSGDVLELSYDENGRVFDILRS